MIPSKSGVNNTRALHGQYTRKHRRSKRGNHTFGACTYCSHSSQKVFHSAMPSSSTTRRMQNLQRTERSRGTNIAYFITWISRKHPLVNCRARNPGMLRLLIPDYALSSEQSTFEIKNRISNILRFKAGGYLFTLQPFVCSVNNKTLSRCD